MYFYQEVWKQKCSDTMIQIIANKDVMIILIQFWMGAFMLATVSPLLPNSYGVDDESSLSSDHVSMLIPKGPDTLSHAQLSINRSGATLPLGSETTPRHLSSLNLVDSSIGHMNSS